MSSSEFLTSKYAKLLPLNLNTAKIAYITTAAKGGKSRKHIDDCIERMKRAKYDFEEIDIEGKTKTQLFKILKDKDIIFVAGGNTFYLLEKIQQSNCADVLKDFVNQGKPYIGSSAGSVITGPDISPAYDLDRVEKAPNIKNYIGLGFVEFVTLPHWGSEKFKELYLNKRISKVYTENNKLILITDKQYIHVKNDWYRIEEVK